MSQLQRMRKEMNLEITDRIGVDFEAVDMELSGALLNYKQYICAEILADTLEQVASLPESEAISVNEISIKVLIKKN